MDGKLRMTGMKDNPRETVNILSVLTYAWIVDIFRLGYRKDLEIIDLYKPLNEHKGSFVGNKLSKAWESEISYCNKTKASPSLIRALLRVFGLQIALCGFVLFIIEVFVRVLQPFALGKFLRYFNDDGASRTEAFFYASGIIAAAFIHLVCTQTYWMATVHMAMKIRVSCCSLIYRKALKLSKASLDEITIGELMNLLSNDATRFDTTFPGLHYLWVGPLQTVATTFYMYHQVGFAAIYGIIVFLSFIPLQLWFGKKISILRLRTALRTDKRVRLTNEIIKGIQTIKMYTWEYLFRDLIKNVRSREIAAVRYTSYIKSFILSFPMFVSRLSLFVTILIYVLNGDKISAEKVFMLSAFYANLHHTMTIHFPYEVVQLAELIVSIKRIQNFLMYEEIEHSTKSKMDEDIKKEIRINEEITLDNSNITTNNLAVVFDNVYAKWINSESENTLSGININIKSGELVAVIGKVGSGKSSLLNVILNELPVFKGKIMTSEKLSYASQEPWLFSGSVRQNILFGRPMDHQKYQKVIKVCQLKRDFVLLPYGDKTIIGERGLSLSGGQKARINLARAVYTDVPLYLFDDPFSAVDPHVGKCLFEECIEKYLHGRTRIIVTHQIQFLHNVDKIIVLQNGNVIATGTYDELINMDVHIGALDIGSSNESRTEPLSYSRSDSRRSDVSLDSFPSIDQQNQRKSEPKEIEETRTTGSVTSYIYILYLKAGGNNCVIFFVLMLYIITQSSVSGTDWFLSFWTKFEERNEINGNIQTINGTEIISDESKTIFSSRNTYIYIFISLLILTIVMSINRSFAFFEICLRASKRLHNQMFHCISRATMHFLNTNTSARILNRFTKDLGIIDELMPVAFIDCIQISLGILGIVILITISNPWLLIPTAIVAVLLFFFRAVYIATSRSVKRLEGVSRSPIYNHFIATLQGLITVRSFNADEILIEEFDHHLDVHSSAWYIFIVSSRAFAFWLDCVNVIYSLIVTMSFLFLPRNSELSHGANVGLAITQSLGLTGELQWGMRQSAELENQMTSVERVREYTKIESEPPLESQLDKKPSRNWPTNAQIEFKNVYLSYGVMESPVLKNINFIIKPCERVGVVGRTGAGKSSVMLALFRLAEIKGVIEIDGVDTGKIGLHDLRSKISIIPQEPFLFTGSLRQNLDPFQENEDSVLWAALEDVEIKEMGLEMEICDGGTNLSIGQRQLVCLARAIIKKNKILILDEATANVDLKTDEFIQLTIRNKFSDCTLLTIAHRLNTVMDSDRILVMDAGNVVEFDHPHILLQNRNGFLSSMVRETGTSMAEALSAIAKKNFENRQQTQTISTRL